MDKHQRTSSRALANANASLLLPLLEGPLMTTVTTPPFPSRCVVCKKDMSRSFSCGEDKHAPIQGIDVNRRARLKILFSKIDVALCWVRCPSVTSS